MAPPEFSEFNESAEAAKLMNWEAPKAQGLYDPQQEHEACGVGFIVAIDGKRNHKVTFLYLTLVIFFWLEILIN